MTNDHIKSEIPAYLAGGLPETRNLQIDAHVAACEKCRVALAKARAKQARLNREALKKASPERMPNLFLARQGKEVGIDRPPPKGPWIVLAGVIAAAAAYGLYHHFSSGFRSADESAPAANSAGVDVSSAPAVSTAAATAAPPAAELPTVPSPAPAPLEVKQEWKGADSGIKESRVVVIRNEEAWSNLWGEMQQKEPLPPVRFSRSILICVFGGARTAGAAVKLGRILERADDVIIPYGISGTPVAISTVSVSPAGLSHPYLVSVIPRVEKRIRLTQREENP